MVILVKKVLLLFGGPSNEHLISCKSVSSIVKNIDYKKYDVSICGISEDGIWYSFNDNIDLLENGNWLVSNNKKIENIVEFIKSFDVVFPVIHGKLGEDGSLAGFFNTFNINYVASGNLSHGICYDKYYTKLICNNFDIKQIDYVVINKNEKKYLKKVSDNLTYPVIVKPCKSGSSIGINISYNRSDLSKHIKEAFIYDNRVIVEKYIENRREFECGVLSSKKNIISSVGEIIIEDGFYDYDSKYITKSKVLIPAFINKELENKIKDTTSLIFNIMGCKSLARVDFIYDNDKDILYFNEINTIPGFTDISMYSKAFIYDGISYKDLISKIIESA